MVITDIESLVKQIKGSSVETGTELVLQYGNKRETKGINEAWMRIRSTLRKLGGIRKRSLKNHILNYDEEIGAIPLTEFTLYFAAIEDELRAHSKGGIVEVRKFSENLQDLMYTKLGNIKIDRRTIFGM